MRSSIKISFPFCRLTLSLIIKRFLSTFLFRVGIAAQNIQKRRGKAFLILMYHRVLPVYKENCSIEAGMYVEPETFEKHISYLSENFEICSFKRISDFDTQDGRKTGKPICVLTFDDGWHDFYRYAFPIIKKYKVPATVFLPTGLIGTGETFWTEELSALFKRKGDLGGSLHKSENSHVEEIEVLKGSMESRLEGAINLLKPLREEMIAETLEELKVRWSIESSEKERSFLNWDEVIEMYESGLVTFGSHTVSHRILTTLNPGEIRRELEESRNQLIEKGVVDSSAIPFSYPNGNYDAHIIELARESGYSLGVTTGSGWNGFEENLFELKRIPVHQDISSTTEMFGCRVAEIF